MTPNQEVIITWIGFWTFIMIGLYLESIGLIY